MEQHTTRALVLRSIPFQEKQFVLTLFSQKIGLVSTIAERQRARKTLLCCTEPFCEAEFLLYERHSELLFCKETSLVSQNLDLRQSLAYLQTGSAMLHAILHSQLPRKPSEELYTMLIAFLKQISLFSSQTVLLAFFYTKMLQHEGVFHPFPEEEDSHLPLSLVERNLLQVWMSRKRFAEMHKEECPAPFLDKIKQLFYEKNGH